MQAGPIQLVWFKRDLRTVDHAPLAEAAKAGPVLPIYVVEPDYWRGPDASRRQWLAIRPALAALSERLARLGAPLIVRVGSAPELIERIHAQLPIARLLAHQETGNDWTFERDKAVRRLCRRLGIEMAEFVQDGVVRGLKNRDRWARAHGAFMAAPLIPEPPRLIPASGAAPGPIPTAMDLGLAPDGCDTPQPGTRAEGWRQLESFAEGRGAGYRRGMSSPLTAPAACSRLSVPMATGALSPREVMAWTLARRRSLAEAPAIDRPVPLTALDSLISRLHWRGHFTQKLESEPAMELRSVHPMHEAARRVTQPDDPVLMAWAEGRTGYPFLDACLRSLIATGWLNFRMRAMIQAFAAYHLGLDWRVSGLVLARLFTDYEPGIHWPQAQMQAGQTGINTPRIYNPLKQALDQDPEGRFTRAWVPELAGVGAVELLAPWSLNAPGYPAPIIDHEAAAQAARARLTAVRQTPGYREASLAVFQRHGSRRRRMSDDNPAASRAKASAKEKAKAAAQRQLSFEF